MSTSTVDPYARILAVEVWNFMSIEHGRIEFDDTNIINLKGYNDSGKSGMLTALRVALLNSNPSKQVSFIQDDKEYFRVVVYFADGVQLLRDKYVNGQSLLEMYKDGQCIFSTKNGKTLTRLTEIPAPVADYLGLVTFDGGALNARSCFEKQLGVQTTGAENYKMFNTVLKSEEIATAGALLNNDKNKLAADITAVDAEIQAQKSLLGSDDRITCDMISWLKEHDKALDMYEVQESRLNGLKQHITVIQSVKVYPEVGSVDVTQLSKLQTIRGVVTELGSIHVTPELPSVDGSTIAALAAIQDISSQLKSVRIAPEVPSLDDRQVSVLDGIRGLISQLNSVDTEVGNIDQHLIEATAELQQLQKEAENHGTKLVKCPSCGELFDPEMMHAHA